MDTFFYKSLPGLACKIYSIVYFLETKNLRARPGKQIGKIV